MSLKKCPRCELNYIREGEAYCNVCLREMKHAISHEQPAEEEALVCSECGEAPAVRGSDLCVECLKEQKRQVELENAAALDAAFDEALAVEEEPEEEIEDQ